MCNRGSHESPDCCRVFIHRHQRCRCYGYPQHDKSAKRGGPEHCWCRSWRFGCFRGRPFVIGERLGIYTRGNSSQAAEGNGADASGNVILSGGGPIGNACTLFHSPKSYDAYCLEQLLFVIRVPFVNPSIRVTSLFVSSSVPALCPIFGAIAFYSSKFPIHELSELGHHRTRSFN